MEKEKLEKILENHKLWLEGKGGARANLQWANLRRADLQWANLQWANLQWANLQGANLQEADLQWANLHGANLHGANLQGANLRRANLQEADLQWANLHGANLDFSCWPLWCGSFNVKTDKKIFNQLIYHICQLDCKDKEIKEAQNYLIKLANQFHRIGKDCQKLIKKKGG